MARISLDELRAAPPQADREKLDATTEADIRRHTVEDGQDPDAGLVGYRLVPAPAEIRKRLGMTQQSLADALRVPVTTYRNWEQGRKVPDPAAATLLRVLDREPVATLRALDVLVTVKATGEIVYQSVDHARLARARKERREAIQAPAGVRPQPRRPTRRGPFA